MKRILTSVPYVAENQLNRAAVFALYSSCDDMEGGGGQNHTHR